MSGKNPDSSDKFIVVDNIGSNSSRQSFKILVGTGSSKQDLWCNGKHHNSTCDKLSNHLMLATSGGLVAYPVVVVEVDGIRCRALLNSLDYLRCIRGTH